MAIPCAVGDAADVGVRSGDGVLALLPADPQEQGGRGGAGGEQGVDGFFGSRRREDSGMEPVDLILPRDRIGTIFGQVTN